MEVPDHDEPLRKRTRVKRVSDGETSKPGTQRRQLFAPFRALGLVTNHVPFVLQTRSHKGATDGPQIHILTCLGRSWALWEGRRINLLFVGPDYPEPISCLRMDGSAVWAAMGPHAVRCIRGKETNRLSNPLGTNLSHIAIFGERLLALTEDGQRLLVWDTTTKELSGTIEFDQGFTAAMLLHPATYLNKVLVASSQGSLQLWNIRSQTCIHKFDPKKLCDTAGENEPCAITALVQSPAIDVVGIGFSSGEISLYDIRADERLMRIFMEGGPVHGLAFRSDGQSVLASASANGNIALWDLNENGRLLHNVRGAHSRAVTAIEWVPGQPLLVSSGEDNSLKQWVFDSATAAPRQFKHRSGHHDPPHLIRFYGEDGKKLLTASRDRSLRCTSIVRESRCFELSQGHIAAKATSLNTPVSSLKLPPIISLSCSSTRGKDWDDILTAHKQDAAARTWLLRRRRLGKWVLSFVDEEKERKRKQGNGSVKAVCVTACGNFGLAGTSTGAIRMWNMQSGIRRKTFNIGPQPPEVAARASGSERAIVGLATDALNRLVIAGTSDGTVVFLDFHTTKVEHVIVLPTTCSSITLHRDSDLLAIVCDDLVVRLVDIETRRIVREMGGFRGNILDLAFSTDSRWLIVTSTDSVIRTFDIPSGRLIDVFRTSSIATSVAFSPTNEFLATSHVDSVGVYLWANRGQYTDVSLQGVVEDDIADLSLPSLKGRTGDEALEALSALHIGEPKDVFATPQQLAGDLITLTLLPRARWQTLLNLDIIHQRNKPKEPPKPPQKAPFFLPTLSGVEHRFAVDHRVEAAKSEKPTKRLEAGATQAESTFYKKLTSEDPEGGYEAFFSYLKTLAPAALDLELRALTSLEALNVFTNSLTRRLRVRRDFECVQALLGVLVRIHGEVFIENPELRPAMETLLEAQRQESTRLMELLASSMGALGFVRDVL